MSKRVNQSTAPDEPAWERIQEYLEREMSVVRKEIRSYPAPIPACDAQFNYLLERREALASEILRVRGLMSNDEVSVVASNPVESYLNASAWLSDAAKTEIRAFVENGSKQGEEE